MIIRKGRLKDIDAAAELELDMYRYHRRSDPLMELRKGAKKYAVRHMRSYLYGRDKLLLVAEADDSIIGFATACIKEHPPVLKHRKHGHVGATFVKPRYRKRGIAKEFFRIIHEWFKERKLNQASMYVSAKNEVAKKAWDRLGYKDRFLFRQRKLP